MMQFDLVDIDFTRGNCIVVPAILYPCSKNKNSKFNQITYLILDTGATSVHISKRQLYKLGYNDTMFTKDTKPSFAVTGKYYATLCKTERLDFCGLNFRNHNVKVWNPPAGHHTDGIIGMNILRYFNISINADTQKVIIERSQQATNAKLRKST